MNALLKLKDSMVKLLEGALTVAVAVLTLDVLWQVFTRYALNDPSQWTEELARMLLVWVSFLGAGVAFARKGHLGVDCFENLLEPSSKRLLQIVVNVLVIFFAAVVMMAGGGVLVGRMLSINQISPALGVKVGYIYLAVPISGMFIVLLALEMIVKTVTGQSPAKRDGKEGG